MKTKLTLSLDKDLVAFAHQQARRQQKTISSMFSEFLLGDKQRRDSQRVVSIDQMVGTLSQYSLDDSKQGIRAAYAKKHLS